ncbi:MAG: hypothetical protein P5698_23035 [Limnospira sp. PMC 1295.21]|nr:hypothetical protein [Limnospira sp. PMC 1293.21]MDT9292800.1 hypothetical protein [Limnospira sp. PMC 1295.21]
MPGPHYERSPFPTTQGSHIPVGAGSTAYILLHQQLYKPALLSPNNHCRLRQNLRNPVF